MQAERGIAQLFALQKNGYKILGIRCMSGLMVARLLELCFQGNKEVCSKCACITLCMSSSINCLFRKAAKVSSTVLLKETG